MEITELNESNCAEIYKIYAPKLQRMFLMMLGRKEPDPLSTAEDLMQVTFLHAWAGRRTYVHESEIGTWLYAIGRNIFRDYYRSTEGKHAKESVSLEDLGEVFQDSMLEEPLQERKFSAMEVRSVIMNLISDVLPKYRIAFLLHDFEGFSYKEVAAKTGQSPDSVKMASFRAKEYLRNNKDQFREFLPQREFLK